MILYRAGLPTTHPIPLETLEMFAAFDFFAEHFGCSPLRDVAFATTSLYSASNWKEFRKRLKLDSTLYSIKLPDDAPVKAHKRRWADDYEYFVKCGDMKNAYDSLRMYFTDTTTVEGAIESSTYYSAAQWELAIPKSYIVNRQWVVA